MIKKLIYLSLFGLSGIAILIAAIIFQNDARAFSLMNGANISVVFTPAPTPTPILWTLKDKINEAKILLAGMTLNVGTKDISYTENRISPTSITVKTLKDPEKEIALAALNTDTGEISILKI